jgi:hypothetical protein
MITNVPGQDKTATINALKKMPNIFLITEIIGEFDVLAIAAVKDFTSIIDMMNTIRKLPSVEQAEATFVTDTLFPAGEEFNRLFPAEKNQSLKTETSFPILTTGLQSQRTLCFPLYQLFKAE